MRSIVLLGAGSWTRSVVPLFSLQKRLLQFYDEPRHKNEEWFSRPVSLELLPCEGYRRYNAPIGDPRYKRKLVNMLNKADPDPTFINLIWKDNIIVKTAEIGKGIMIQPTAKIYHNAKIGDHVSMCGDGNIGHDSIIGDYVTTGPYVLLAGGVKIGDGVFLGAGCKILPEKSIGEGATIGAGAVVNQDVPPNEIWVGVPARYLRTDDVEW